MKYFLKKLLDHEIFKLMVSWGMIFFFFFEKLVKPSGSPSYTLNVRSLKAVKCKVDRDAIGFFPKIQYNY